MSAVQLSVVVLSWNTREILRACLSALARDVSREPREIIVVDNGSSDGSADMVARDFPSVRLLRNAENRLYAEGNNQGARLATGRYLCLLNSDTEVRSGALDLLVRFLAEHPDHAAAAPKLVNPDGSVQRACMRFPSFASFLCEGTSLGMFPPGSWVTWWYHMGDFDHLHSRDVPQPPGACLLMRREEFLEAGGLDPALSLFFNDVDLCRTLWSKGRRIRYIAEAEVLHHQGSSTRGHPSQQRNLYWFRNRAAYCRKQHGRTGDLWRRAIEWLWDLESRARIRLGPRDRDAQREALTELRKFLQQCSSA